MQPKLLKLNDADNVAIAMAEIEAGESLAPLGEKVAPLGKSLAPLAITAAAPIPRGHKLAITPIKSGEHIIKYGQVIGVASSDIDEGAPVHTHNVAMLAPNLEHEFGVGLIEAPPIPQKSRAKFHGFKRSDGKIGTRNYIGIIASVNCSATAVRMIAKEAERLRLAENYARVDGIVPIIHGAGCGTGTDDEAFYKLQRTIWGFATHPNFASVLMLGLGCETNQIPLMLEAYGNPPADKFHFYTLQGEGGTRKTVERGLEWLEGALSLANKAQREPIPAAEITLALQCGGSDGFSGITANPALGVAVDLLVSHGGTAVLAETPEIYGAEHLLTRRARTPEVGTKLLNHLTWWEEYTKKLGSKMDNNPAPGNKAGGLTTILEKSLGAVAKAGTTPLNGVYKYAEPIFEKGLVFMDSPGYDPVSITGEVAAGCNIVCFTTGRGSCYGNKPAPTIKIASNTPMFERMRDDMDINCGTIADGGETVAEAGTRIFDTILAVASGKKTLSETLGVGDVEFAPWQTYAQM